MNDNNVMAIIFMGLFSLGCAGIVVAYWSTVRKSLLGMDVITCIKDQNSFMQAMRGFLDTRLSKDPTYSANPPDNNLELYEFYRKWMRRFEWKPWRLVTIAITAQVLIGIFTICYFSEDLAVWTILSLMIACTVMVALVSLLFVWLIKRSVAVLATIDERFVEIIAPEWEALVKDSREEREAQAYRLSAIFAVPTLITDEDIAAHPSCMGEASFLIRGGVALLAGIGFFLCMIFLGLALIDSNALKESVFPAFLITGLIGIPVIWISLLFFWEVRKQKRAKAKGQWIQAQEAQQTKGALSDYTSSPLPDAPLPPFPPPQAEVTVCKGCGGKCARDAEACPFCGNRLLKP
jgi:hypothetical protein